MKPDLNAGGGDLNESLRILVVHSSAELYGSDRSLLDFVRHAPPSMEISVVLPEPGPLIKELQQAGATVSVAEICKIQRSMLSMRGAWAALRAAWRAVFALRALTSGERRPDVVYSNTVAILGGALFARLHGIPHVWHVREILEGTPRLANAFRTLVRLFARQVICNSNQTRQWISSPATAARCSVVWNGVAAAKPAGRRISERSRLHFGDGDVVFALAGRINGWKGQTLLVDAFDELRARGISGVKLWIVGSAFAGQEHFEASLAKRVAASPYRADIVVEPFRPDVEAVWEAADVVTVPSTEPEPFGRVAIEAMAFARPVIVAGHGGLLDIVEDGVSGLIFEPRHATALALAMQRLSSDRGWREQLGHAAQMRQQQFFSVEAYAENVGHTLRVAAGSKQHRNKE